MDNLMFSLNATLPVFLVMVIGWALGQKGFLPKQFCTVADKLVFKVTPVSYTHLTLPTNREV